MNQSPKLIIFIYHYNIGTSLKLVGWNDFCYHIQECTLPSGQYILILFQNEEISSN